MSFDEICRKGAKFVRSLLVKVALHFSQLPGDFIKLKDTSHGCLRVVYMNLFVNVHEAFVLKWQ